MIEVLLNMIKEEWRMHSALFGSVLFAIFPLIIFIFSFLFAFYACNIINVNQLLLVFHYIFILMGLSVGAFGILGREVMNRRFGHASLIAFSSRTLPLSEKFIFFNFFVKDLIYYLALWIIPFVAGVYTAFSIKSININFFVLLTSIFLSFLTSLSLSFFLSTIYVHSKRIAIAIVFSAVAFSKYIFPILKMLPSISFIFQPSLKNVFYSFLISSTLSLFSIIFLKVDYPERKKRHKNILKLLEKILNFGNYGYFIAKDFLDLNRSEGGLAKLIFSLILPSLFLWLLLSYFLNFIPFSDFLTVFSIMLGIISSSTYNWITEFDLFSSYSFMPIKVSSIIKSKIITYSIVNSFCIIILFISATKIGFNTLFPSLLAFFGVSAYVLAINIYLTGLHPNMLLYNGKILLQFLFSIAPILVLLIFLSKNNVFYFLILFLLAFSYLIIRKSLEKWDQKDEIVF
ncbi:MAG: hypothetical protein QW350_00770 [Candidatus Aenigmatarchaeota archaeon]